MKPLSEDQQTPTHLAYQSDGKHNADQGPPYGSSSPIVSKNSLSHQFSVRRKPIARSNIEDKTAPENYDDQSSESLLPKSEQPMTIPRKPLTSCTLVSSQTFVSASDPHEDAPAQNGSKQLTSQQLTVVRRKPLANSGPAILREDSKEDFDFHRDGQVSCPQPAAGEASHSSTPVSLEISAHYSMRTQYTNFWPSQMQQPTCQTCLQHLPLNSVHGGAQSQFERMQFRSNLNGSATRDPQSHSQQSLHYRTATSNQGGLVQQQNSQTPSRRSATTLDRRATWTAGYKASNIQPQKQQEYNQHQLPPPKPTHEQAQNYQFHQYPTGTYGWSNDGQQSYHFHHPQHIQDESSYQNQRPRLPLHPIPPRRKTILGIGQSSQKTLNKAKGLSGKVKEVAKSKTTKKVLKVSAVLLTATLATVGLGQIGEGLEALFEGLEGVGEDLAVEPEVEVEAEAEVEIEPEAEEESGEETAAAHVEYPLDLYSTPETAVGYDTFPADSALLETNPIAQEYFDFTYQKDIGEYGL